jgi:hypothetical protein
MDDWQEDEAQLRRVRELPVQPYVGLTLAEAEERAATEGRHVRVLTSLDGPRHLDLVFDRLNVELDRDGRVRAADAG